MSSEDVQSIEPQVQEWKEMEKFFDDMRSLLKENEPILYYLYGKSDLFNTDGTSRTHARVTPAQAQWADKVKESTPFTSRELVIGACVEFAGSHPESFGKFVRSKQREQKRNAEEHERRDTTTSPEQNSEDAPQPSSEESPTDTNSDSDSTSLAQTDMPPGPGDPATWYDEDN